MRIAILGAGFAGLAVTWYVLNYTRGSSTVDLYDPEPIGGGTSGLSSGLLHSYAGKHAPLSWEATRCLKETHRLITTASQAIHKPLILSKGILRPALSQQQVEDFQRCAQTYSDTEWWEKEKCKEKIPELHLPDKGGGLYIKEGLTLNVESYVQGLWQACALLGTQYYQQALISQEDMESYDRVLIAMGPQTKAFPPLKNLPLTPIKGQMLKLKWPEGVKPPPFSLISQKYLVMCADYKSCFVGATFEHSFTSPHLDKERALEEIMPNIVEYFPALQGAEVLECRAAFRASSHNHLPVVGKVSDKFYFFTGLGSKGLLYHAWVGKRVARALLTGDTKHFPSKIYRPL